MMMMMVKATRCQFDLLIEAQTARRDWLLTTDKEQLQGTWTLEQPKGQSNLIVNRKKKIHVFARTSQISNFGLL